jgi:hypothetical protein
LKYLSFSCYRYTGSPPPFPKCLYYFWQTYWYSQFSACVYVYSNMLHCAVCYF